MLLIRTDWRASLKVSLVMNTYDDGTRIIINYSETAENMALIVDPLSYLVVELIWQVNINATKRKHNIIGYLFLSPWLLGFLVFTAFPFFYTIYISFHSVTVTGLGIKYQFIGLINYINALFRDTYAWGTVTYPQMIIDLVMNLAIFVPTVTVISLILALLLNQNIKGRGLLRTIYFLPVIILSGPVMSQFINTGVNNVEGVERVFVIRLLELFS